MVKLMKWFLQEQGEYNKVIKWCSASTSKSPRQRHTKLGRPELQTHENLPSPSLVEFLDYKGHGSCILNLRIHIRRIVKTASSPSQPLCHQSHTWRIRKCHKSAITRTLILFRKAISIHLKAYNPYLGYLSLLCACLCLYLATDIFPSAAYNYTHTRKLTASGPLNVRCFSGYGSCGGYQRGWKLWDVCRGQEQ